MPVLKAKLAKGVEPNKGENYKVISVEEIKTAVQGFTGLRVKLEPDKRKANDENEYTSMIWMREEAGIKSKLGAFIAAFADFYNGDEEKAINTDNWLGHVIRVVNWEPRARELRVLS